MMDDVLALVTDLFFQSRIAAASSYAGRAVRFVSQASADDRCRLALVDLDAGTDVVAAIRTWSESSGAVIVAFGPHVDVAGRRAARTAGAARVLAKSKFVTELPAILRATVGVSTQTDHVDGAASGADD